MFRHDFYNYDWLNTRVTGNILKCIGEVWSSVLKDAMKNKRNGAEGSSCGMRRNNSVSWFILESIQILDMRTIFSVSRDFNIPFLGLTIPAPISYFSQILCFKELQGRGGERCRSQACTFSNSLAVLYNCNTHVQNRFIVIILLKMSKTIKKNLKTSLSCQKVWVPSIKKGEIWSLEKILWSISVRHRHEDIVFIWYVV